MATSATLTCGDQALDHIPETDDLFRKALRRLQSTCSHRGILPQSHQIPNESISEKGEVVALGAFADAHEAELDGKKVCVKALRSYAQDIDGITKKVRLFLLVSASRMSLKQSGR